MFMFSSFVIEKCTNLLKVLKCWEESSSQTKIPKICIIFPKTGMKIDCCSILKRAACSTNIRRSNKNIRKPMMVKKWIERSCLFSCVCLLCVNFFIYMYWNLFGRALMLKLLDFKARRIFLFVSFGLVAHGHTEKMFGNHDNYFFKHVVNKGYMTNYSKKRCRHQQKIINP